MINKFKKSDPINIKVMRLPNFHKNIDADTNKIIKTCIAPNSKIS